ncbi:MAG: MarR family transcriptional regulator [Dehalococcoidia bacterium]|nr:MarR family transcriptional regulator [Dehalococcoidia bacterium]MDD5494073.1 MarR family transcriptional regulator [Dehalococcoidia bacterium]
MTESERFSRNVDFSNEVHRLLGQIAKNNEMYEQACVTFFGVTTSQGGTILSLPINSTLKMNELSAVVGVDSSTMTRMIDQLVDKGLVYRKVDEKDRRLVCVGLTAPGRKLHRELDSAFKGYQKDSLGEIREEERAAIIQSLEKLNGSIAKGVENCCKKYCGCGDSTTCCENK